MKPIDLAHGTSLTGIDEKDLNIFLALFMDSLPTDERKLKQAYANNAFDAVDFTAENMLSGAFCCGVPILQDALKQLLMALQENINNEQVEGLYNAVLVAMSELKAAYKKFAPQPSSQHAKQVGFLFSKPRVGGSHFHSHFE